MSEISEYVGIAISACLVIVGSVIGYTNRDSFRRGSSKGQSEVTTTIISNTIKELERTNDNLEKTNEKLGKMSDTIIRLQERLGYTCRQINELRDRLNMPKVHFE